MDTLVQLAVEWGYWGLFLSAFVAGSILPFGSEAVLVVLVRMGLDPVVCVAVAAAGNTLGGMTCYGIGALGRPEWIARLGVPEKRLAQARRFLGGRGAVMGFFAFLPAVGEAVAVVLGLMRSNVWVTLLSMAAGKALRYALIVLGVEGLVSLL